MSWETRGMAMELMNMGDFDQHRGTLPMEDDLWRAVLGLPSKRSIQMALKNSVQARGLRDQHELDVAWETVWKVELLRWFVKIDQDFIDKHPQYASCEGRYWHPLLEHTEEQQSPAKTRKTAATKTKTSTPRKTKKITPLIDEQWDYPVIRYTTGVLKKHWDTPLTSEARTSLWNTALELLGVSDSKEERTSRQFLGKLIKDFGEQGVAAAIGQLVVRPIRPADPKSFLRKQLKNNAQGSNAVQKARDQRSHLPL